MSDYKSSITKYGDGKYRVDFSYKTPDGKRHRTCKRGFKLQKDAVRWQKNELPNELRRLEQQAPSDDDLTMAELITEYMEKSMLRRRETTCATKQHIIETKILPYFKDMKVTDVTTAEVLKWQNSILKARKPNGEEYAETYLRTINNQLSAILNHAVTFHNLPFNPVLRVERLGKKKAPERDFWTVEEYLRFIKEMQDKPVFYYAFQMLFWCGIREGELLALTPKSFDLQKHTVKITNTYYRLNGKDVIGDTKTDASRRTVTMPALLVEEIREYLDSLYGIDDDTRVFPLSKHSLYKAMNKGCAASGVKRVPVHSLRHSHITLLENEIMCATTKDVANRAGHSSTGMTMLYTHSYRNKDAQIADELNKFMEDNNVSKEV